MPSIKFPNLYRLAFRSAQIAFSQPLRQQFAVMSREGTALYRFVGYRNSMPQVESAGRTQFLPLAKDISNRWTGSDLLGGGRQGLYLSAEFLNQGDPFPEVSHYQEGGQGSSDLVPYFEYSPGSGTPIGQQMKVAFANNLKSMFLFTLTKDLKGLDLRLPPEGNPLLDAVLEQMKQDPYFQAVKQEVGGTIDIENVSSMYMDPNGADFCRALGNAALELPNVEHVLVTSVRDGVSTNVVARTPEGAPSTLEFLKPEGRATFFVTPEGLVGNGVFSISDMLYNANFESPTSPPPGLPAVQALRETLIQAQQDAIDELATQLTSGLMNKPGNNQMDKLVERIADVKSLLGGDDYAATFSAIQDLNSAVRAAAQDEATVSEFKASIELSSSVAKTLATIADSVRAAQERIDGMEPEPPDIIDDPSPESLDPRVVEPPPAEP